MNFNEIWHGFILHIFLLASQILLKSNKCFTSYQKLICILSYMLNKFYLFGKKRQKTNSDINDIWCSFNLNINLLAYKISWKSSMLLGYYSISKWNILNAMHLSILSNRLNTFRKLMKNDRKPLRIAMKFGISSS